MLLRVPSVHSIPLSRRIVLATAVLVLLSACSGAPTRGEWLAGAHQSAADPQTWGPLAGALIVAATGTDESISEWASEQTPVFGSRRRAASASDQLRGFLRVESYTAALATAATPAQLGEQTALLLATDLGTDLVTDAVKVASDRERPDRSDRRSFPSGHTSSAFAYAGFNRHLWRAHEVRPSLQAWLYGVNQTAAWGVAWSRVEAERHYLSDVLVGAALGNFMAGWLTRVYAGERETELVVGLTPNGAQFGVLRRF